MCALKNRNLRKYFRIEYYRKKLNKLKYKDKFQPKYKTDNFTSHLRELVPAYIWQKFLPKYFNLNFLSRYDKDEIIDRVNFYNKLSSKHDIDNNAIKIVDLWKVNAPSEYKHDAWRTLRWFDQKLKWIPAFGDVSSICAIPSVTKSRPIAMEGEGNANNVLLKWDRCRHFNFISDPYDFSDKMDKSVFMADIGDPGKLNRVEFMKLYFGSEICDCGSIRNLAGLPDEWLKPPMKIKEMLKYKFIIALEGNDVATNLKWIMSSNSLAIMPRPTCETWFMESRLIPDYHYVEIKADYSDLKEKMDYYSHNTEKAENIIKHAHEYVNIFKDNKKENLIEYLVMLKYFCMTGQNNCWLL